MAPPAPTKPPPSGTVVNTLLGVGIPKGGSIAYIYNGIDPAPRAGTADWRNFTATYNELNAGVNFHREDALSTNDQREARSFLNNLINPVDAVVWIDHGTDQGISAGGHLLRPADFQAISNGLSSTGARIFFDFGCDVGQSTTMELDGVTVSYSDIAKKYNMNIVLATGDVNYLPAEEDFFLPSPPVW